MLGYVHLTAGRPVLERRAAAGMTYWALEGDLDGGLFPGRRLRRWIGRLERCGVSHAALPPGREGDFAPLRPVLPDGLRLALLPQLLDALAPAGDTALLLVLFCFFPLPGHWLLDGMLDGSLWLQIAFYCMMQAGFYVAIVLAPDWVGRFQQRRYEERVLSGREKFESRKEVMKAREEREKSANGSKSGEKR